MLSFARRCVYMLFALDAITRKKQKATPFECDVPLLLLTLRGAGWGGPLKLNQNPKFRAKSGPLKTSNFPQNSQPVFKKPTKFRRQPGPILKTPSNSRGNRGRKWPKLVRFTLAPKEAHRAKNATNSVKRTKQTENARRKRPFRRKKWTFYAHHQLPRKKWAFYTTNMPFPRKTWEVYARYFHFARGSWGNGNPTRRSKTLKPAHETPQLEQNSPISGAPESLFRTSDIGNQKIMRQWELNQESGSGKCVRPVKPFGYSLKRIPLF